MFCGKCGKENVDDIKFCVHCGSMLAGTGGDTLDRQVTIAGSAGQPQYDTLDVAATQGKELTVLGGQYRIVKKLGAGGMGVVYLAEDMEMRDRLVAVKVLPPNLADNVRSVENLRKEAITAINLNHPNIIRLYGFHSDGAIKFLVMEYIDGQTLEEKLAGAPKGVLDIDETTAIAEKIALALDYAHGRKSPVFHRDLKPSNVMISNDGEVKLLDFGIAREMKDSYTRITGKQDTTGTLPYMSPEQVRGKKPSAAMDIYALGVVCYECLSGHPPFYTGELIYQILHEEPEDLEDVPSHIGGAIQKALAKEPVERPGTAVDLIELLKSETTASKKGAELPLAVAPFGEEKAKEYQKLTAEALGLPVEKSIDLGGGVKMEFVLIPAGEFYMGSQPSEKDSRDDERPIHRVRIGKPFYVSRFTAIQEQYLMIVGKNPSSQGGTSMPVEELSWEDATEFCKVLTQKHGETYRLPTEAEWEYACRAGNSTRFSFGDNDARLGDYAWFSDNSQNRNHPVGQKKPNAFGLYDMHGNVYEWCRDRYKANYYVKSPSVDPQGPLGGRHHVVRGGSRFMKGMCCRSASRRAETPKTRMYDIGFRVVLEIE